MAICNTYLGLSIISIILIISIIILILYKNHKDSKINQIKSNNNKNDNKINKEYFTIASDADELTIMNNNKDINDIIREINKIRPQNYINELYEENEEQIDINLQNDIKENINRYINNIKENDINDSNTLDDNITNLENKLIDLENITNKLKLNKITEQNYSKIKSLNNGQEITLTQTPNTKYTNSETGKTTNGYMVNMNDGCLSVGAIDYNIYKCNDKNQKHLFSMEHIINEQEYEKHIDKSLPFDNIDKKKISLSFYNDKISK